MKLPRRVRWEDEKALDSERQQPAEIAGGIEERPRPNIADQSFLELSALQSAILKTPSTS
jgi:hypothetical protein